MIKFLNSKKMNIFIVLILLLTIIIGNIYLLSVMSKIRLMAESKEINSNIKKVSADISKLKVEIDGKVDLDRIKETARKKLKMSMTDRVIYVKIKKDKPLIMIDNHD